ncbi:CocE/NonD family hydrolase [Paracoccus albus]|uniref:CocE/NonD family hydrolase n=1 Tax=Paracoccus albus TaxID=3017784 RepID=UPI0022F03EAD|nr:CocE/NonD family hydrolase [Paracoccus albus]WBU60585.1 CocE/NonD family hydrolase [Paracoccus albus]
MKRFTILDSVETAMRDGTILRGDVWLPDGDGPWPVLLQRTPYRRADVHGAQYISALEFQSALRRGMAVMVQDTRGRYGSDGEFDPFLHEGKDGADTIAWLLKQPFCNGQVGMFGASYVGATQVLAAAENPPGLLAISPQLTTARHGETWTYRGGAIELGFVLLWIIEALGPADLARRLPSMEAEAAERLQAFMARLLTDPDAAYGDLPDIADDLYELAPYAREWLDVDRALASSSDREHLDDLAQCRVAMLVTAGWNDLFAEGSIELFETARARYQHACDCPDRLIIGPWSHGNPKDRQGEMWHGYTASTAMLSDAQLDFFSDIFSGRMPRRPMVSWFQTGTNIWHEADDWPLPEESRLELHLDGDRLRQTKPSSPNSRSWTFDPNSPVPTTGGATFLPGLLLGRNSGPMRQSEIECREDVITFTSDPLTIPLDVIGLVAVELTVASSVKICDWTGRLCEVTPNGESFGLVDGILRSSQFFQDDLISTTQLVIKLGHIGHQFALKNRIRLQIASSNFPRFDVCAKSGTTSSARASQSYLQTVMTGRLVLPSRCAGLLKL